MKRHWGVTGCLRAVIVSKLSTLQDVVAHIPAKSGHDENSNEYEMKESKGIPASLGADCGIAIGFDLVEI
jgi:hypothetical protein